MSDKLDQISLEMGERIEDWVSQCSKASLRDLYEHMFGSDDLVEEFDHLMER